MKKKYIKDYIPDETGKSYIYKGRYYVSTLSEEETARAAVLQKGYGIFSILGILGLLNLPALGNRTLYVVLPMEFILLCLFFYLVGSFAMRKTDRRMELRMYEKAYQGPMQALTIGLILEFFSISGQLIGNIFTKTEILNYDIILAMGQILHFVVSAYVWNGQRKRMRLIQPDKREA